MAKPINFPSPHLATELRSTKPTFAKGEAVVLQFTAHNHGQSPAVFCRYHTPFEGVQNNFLQVISPNGAEIEYQGMMKKRLPPGPDDYLQIPSREALSTEFDLREGYPLLKKGTYRIQFRGNASINSLPDSEVLEIEIG